ncbi:MAG: TIGR00153 family protein [Verrucomicrobiae bacterium]|nr:TIGR00153 family protein [Verrucomicrobiae bacterium]
MSILTNLLGESPFAALEAHGERVHECVRLLREAFAAVQSGDRAQLLALAGRICQAETQADSIRNELHESLAVQVLLPIRREDLFNILEHQDSMADRAEDIACLLTYRDLKLPAPLMQQVQEYVENVLTNCELARGIISRLDLLVEASFTGRDALTVSKLITELAEREDDIKPAQTELTRQLLGAEPPLPPVEAVLWMQIVGWLAKLSKHADRTGHGIRMTLKLKSSR